MGHVSAFLLLSKISTEKHKKWQFSCLRSSQKPKNHYSKWFMLIFHQNISKVQI